MIRRGSLHLSWRQVSGSSAGVACHGRMGLSLSGIVLDDTPGMVGD